MWECFIYMYARARVCGCLSVCISASFLSAVFYTIQENLGSVCYCFYNPLNEEGLLSGILPRKKFPHEFTEREIGHHWNTFLFLFKTKQNFY